MADIIVAGNTSGAITISAPLVAGSGVLTLPTGTDTLIGKATTDTLTNKSIAATQLTGTIAASALPAGSVLQVVQGTTATAVTNSTSTYADTGLTASITPKFSTSKILVTVSHNGVYKQNNTYVAIQLLRGASVIVSAFEAQGGYNNTATNASSSSSISYLDSPATTSSTAYKTQFSSGSNIAAANINSSNSTSTITLMEIAG